MRTQTPRRVLAASLAAVLAGMVAAAPAQAAEVATGGEEASLPFIQHDTIRDWQANGNDGIWVQDTRQQWYYASTLGPCIGLNTAWAVSFDARPNGTLDRYSHIILPGNLGRCSLQSFRRSDAPPSRTRKPAKPADADAE